MNSAKWLILSHYFMKRIIGGCFTVSYRCLSRMMGNYHVVVLRGEGGRNASDLPDIKTA